LLSGTAEGVIAPEIEPVPGAAPVEAESDSSVNDALRGLDAKSNMDLIRIVRDFDKGRLPEALAITRLKSYGLNDEEARNVLGLI
jgi:hypothetical protein